MFTSVNRDGSFSFCTHISPFRLSLAGLPPSSRLCEKVGEKSADSAACLLCPRHSCAVEGLSDCADFCSGHSLCGGPAHTRFSDPSHLFLESACLQFGDVFGDTVCPHSTFSLNCCHGHQQLPSSQGFCGLT